MAKLRAREYCARIKNNGNRCKNYRMPDSKFCLAHGGGKVHTSKKRRKLWKNKITHGKTSKILKAGPRVSQLVEEMKRNKDYLDIDENIAIMTTIMRQVLLRAEKDGGLDGVLDKANKFFSMLEKINRALLTKAKIEDGLKHKIDIETIDIAMKQMMGILKQHIKNPLTLRSIADDFSNIRVHDIPMKGHKPRNEHLKQLEETSIDIREAMGSTVADEILDEDEYEEERELLEGVSSTKQNKIIFEMD